MTGTPGLQLVGRDEELRSLVERLDEVHHGGLVLGLVGEPGVGKTALLTGVTEYARAAGFRVLGAARTGSRSTSGSPCSPASR